MKKTISFQSIQNATLVAICTVMATAAQADFDIGGPAEDTPLGSINVFIQEVVNFVSGPIALSFSFLSVLGMAVTFAIAPKMVGAMGLAMRVMFAIIIALNVGAWLAAYAGDSSGIAAVVSAVDLFTV